MAKVDIISVEVLSNPARFKDPFKFRITFECSEALEDDLEWKLVYVGSAYSEKLDQTLDNILVGPVPVGRHQFIFEADCPHTDLIPVEDALGVTVIYIQALFHEKEFIRVGYYINNEYESEEMRENPPSEPDYEKMMRNILASDPRITRFPIDWGDGLVEDQPVALDGEDATVKDANMGDRPVDEEACDMKENSEPMQVGCDIEKHVHCEMNDPSAGEASEAVALASSS